MPTLAEIAERCEEIRERKGFIRRNKRHDEPEPVTIPDLHDPLDRNGLDGLRDLLSNGEG